MMIFQLIIKRISRFKCTPLFTGLDRHTAVITDKKTFRLLQVMLLLSSLTHNPINTMFVLLFGEYCKKYIVYESSFVGFRKDDRVTVNAAFKYIEH